MGGPPGEPRDGRLRLEQYRHPTAASGTMELEVDRERSPIMRKSRFVPVLAGAALLALAVTALPQAPKTPDIIGTWTGTAVIDNGGGQLDITLVLVKSEAGYTGKISDASGF